VLSHWPSSPDRTCDAPAGVLERRHPVAIGAGRAGHATGAVMEGGDAAGVGSGAAGGAPGAVVEANVLGLRRRERGERGQECDGDDAHGRLSAFRSHGEFFPMLRWQ